jgi:hypothetical protein
MEAMALLCNLQADGPATLRKLQELGCRTLEDLERMPVFELAGALESDAAFAQRFIREGRALQQRIGSGEADPEEAQVADPRRSRREEPLARPAGARPSAGRMPASGRAEGAGPEPRSLRLPAQPPGTALRAGLIQGLDAAWCQALIGQGILTLEGLFDAPGLALAKSLGRPYPQLLDLQCLARRQLNQMRAATATIERDDASTSPVPAYAAQRTPRRPLAEPDYTIFPPRPPAAERVGPGAREERAPEHSEARRDAGIGGPFA